MTYPQLTRFALLVLSVFLFTSCGSHRYVEHRSAESQPILPRPTHKENRITQALYTEVQSWLGTPYRLGGNDRKGVDCSGLVCKIYLHVYGKQLHRRSIDQYMQDIRYYVNGNDLQTGNLLFFSTRRDKQVNHVGIYLNDYKFAHASESKGVVIDDIRSAYFIQNWIAGGEVR